MSSSLHTGRSSAVISLVPLRILTHNLHTQRNPRNPTGMVSDGKPNARWHMTHGPIFSAELHFRKVLQINMDSVPVFWMSEEAYMWVSRIRMQPSPCISVLVYPKQREFRQADHPGTILNGFIFNSNDKGNNCVLFVIIIKKSIYSAFRRCYYSKYPFDT